MTDARTAVLTRIAAALTDRPTPAVPRTYRRASGPGDPYLFAERLRDYRAQVRLVPATDTAQAVTDALTEREAQHVVAAPGVPAEWAPRATRAIPDLAGLERTDAVVTACRVAIADTGTIVLDHDAPDQGPRSLTLVPDYHLVVVRADQIVAGVPDAVAALAGVRTQTWISGPSATSDIELERVEGVHGPRTLEVVITLP
ncbi:LUD domain-containing protein [Saccharothrix sp.]|uniref:LutC/YkgG family protein n=1 Tax=Saccharothrix sp. TaxID=1873460 RepID=UPI00281192B8|nr:LUD domain-containing protein [Saccharothrix sp.]